MDDAELFARFREDFIALQNHPGVVLKLGAVEAWAVLGAIQLAARHPGWQGPTRDMAVDVARRIESAVAQTEALRIVSGWGWCEGCDEPGTE